MSDNLFMTYNNIMTSFDFYSQLYPS